MLQGCVAAKDQAAVIGRDGINDDFGALRHFNGLHGSDFALVVFPVANHNEGPPHRVILLLFGQFGLAGVIDGIVQGGAAAILQAVNPGGQQRGIIGEILRDQAVGVESHHKGLVKVAAQGLLQKADGGFLLEGEARAHRTADVDQKP